jgi:HlyD family secretion protein
MKHRTRWSVVLIAAAVIAVGVWRLRPVPRVVVTTAPLTTGSIVREVVATGTVQARRTVEVGAQVSGVVQSLDADYNSVVRKGQVVARLDPSIYSAQLSEARAALTAAEADVAGFDAALDDAATRLRRAQDLAARHLLPPSDLDVAVATRDEATASLHAGQAAAAQAQSAVKQARVNLELTVIRAPEAGIVIERRVDVGQTLAASVQTPVLFRIASDLRDVEVDVAVDESDVAALTPGEQVRFRVDAYPHEIFSGSLVQVRLQPLLTSMSTDPRSNPSSPGAVATAAAVASPGAGTPAASPLPAPAAPTAGGAAVVSYTAVVQVANPEQQLLPGMTAVVTIDGLRRDHAVRIPNGALSFHPSLEVLGALHEDEPVPAGGRGGERTGAWREVWTYDGRQLIPLLVRPGLADENWTELTGGPITAGAVLVTSAAVQRRQG